LSFNISLSPVAVNALILGLKKEAMRVLAVSPQIRYILGMNSFIKGMGSLNLFPPVEKSRKSSGETAWEGVEKAFEAVGNDFEAVGRDMWKAIEDAGRIYNTPKQPAASR
jgi:hypothetical protein